MEEMEQAEVDRILSRQRSKRFLYQLCVEQGWDIPPDLKREMEGDPED